MSEPKLRQDELEQISAFLDGELPADQTRDVARRIDSDPAWAAAADELGKLESLLDAWPTPRLAGDLTTSILAATRRKQPRPAWVQWLAPLATAAAIVAAVLLLGPTGSRPGPEVAGEPTVSPIEKVIEAVPREDRFVVENLDVFEDYDVLVRYETLEALAALEREQPET